MTRGAARSVRSSLRFDQGFIGCDFIRRLRFFAIQTIEEHRVDRDCDLHRKVGVATHRHGRIFIKRAAKEYQSNCGATAIRQPRCSRSFSHLSDASGWLDPHRTDDDRASTSLIGNDRDHPLT